MWNVGVDLECGGELQGHCCGVNHPITLYGPSSLVGSELLRGDLEWPVPHRQPYLLSRLVDRSGNLTPIGEFTCLERIAKESGTHLPPYVSAATKVRPHGQDSPLLFLVVGVGNPATINGEADETSELWAYSIHRR